MSSEPLSDSVIMEMASAMHMVNGHWMMEVL